MGPGGARAPRALSPTGQGADVAAGALQRQPVIPAEIGVVVNPLAGGNRRRDGRLGEFRRIVGDQGIVADPSSLHELKTVAEELCRREIRLLAVCGGDGSFFRTLSAMAAVYESEPLPLFLPLRGGSMNTIAKGLGCRRAAPEAALRSVTGALANGQPLDVVERALVRVNGRFVGFMSGAGTVVSFLQAYYEGSRKGPVGAAQLVARLACAAALRTGLIERVFRWVRARVRCDGVELPFDRFSVLYGSNVAEIGVGFRPTYRAGERSDAFHFLAGPVRARDFLRRLDRFYRGRPADLPNLHDALARHVEIKFEEPQPYMVDGDILDPERCLRMEAGPVLRIVRGWQ